MAEVIRVTTQLHGEPFVMEYPRSTLGLEDLVVLLASGVNEAVVLVKGDGSEHRYELAEHEHVWTEWVEPIQDQPTWWRMCPPCGLQETRQEAPDD